MRNYVDSKEIAHLWAHQSQDSGKCSALMSFYGTKFYSYNTVIAKISMGPSGDRAYLVSEGQYSVTTSRHQGEVRSAIPSNARVFIVPGTGRDSSDEFSDPLRILKSWAVGVEYRLERAGEAKPPKRRKLLADAASVVEKMGEFARFFEISVEFPPIPATPEELAQYCAEKTQREAAAKAKQIAEEKKRAAEQRKKTAKQRLAWLKGLSDNTYGWSQYFPVELRVIADQVETSRGASFPVNDARRGLTLIEVVMASKQPWKRNGNNCRLGHYHIDLIEVTGTVHAGCHVVSWKAIQRIREAVLAA